MSEHWVRFEDAAEAKGFALIPNAVMRDPSLSMQAKYLYGLLKSFAWQDPSTYPGVKALCGAAGVSKDTLGKYLAELVKRGLIEVKRRGQGRTNLYVFKRVTAQGPDGDTGSHQESEGGSRPDGDTGGRNEYSGNEDPTTTSLRGSKPPEGNLEGAKKPSAFGYMQRFADLLDTDALPLSSKERGRLASQIQKALDRGADEKKVRAAMCRLVTRRNEGERLEFNEVFGDSTDPSRGQRGRRRSRGTPGSIAVHATAEDYDESRY
ncbi:MAG: helix-turn-helix domain-containing protein [Actinomycetota bacterium]|nr:helix-turn-helix domain-containing protein [Actinomycetota bacterium]